MKMSGSRCEGTPFGEVNPDGVTEVWGERCEVVLLLGCCVCPEIGPPNGRRRALAGGVVRVHMSSVV